MDLPITFQQEEPLKGRPLDVLDKIDFALQQDDKVEFLKIVKSPEFHKRRSWFEPRTMVYFDALKCASAVLNGSTRGIIDVKDVLINDISALHFAASIGRSPKITKYFLELGNDADAMCDFRTWKQASFFRRNTGDIADEDEDHRQDFTHIDLILEVVANDYDLFKRTKRKSIYELLVHLCYTLRRSMEVLRLLVQHTQRTERLTEQFVHYAHKGKLVHLAALLLAAPELFLTPSLAGVECPFNKLYKHRTYMDEGLSLLLDVFAVVGPKLVAYLRIDFPTMQSGRLPSLEIAFLLREVARKQGVLSPDDYFLRLLKCGEVPEKFVDDSPISEADLVLPYLQYNNIDQAYINRVLPDLNPDEQAYLNRAMENKLSLMPSVRSRLHEFVDDSRVSEVCELVPCLQYNDIDQAYINRVLPDVKPDEQAYLNRAMEIKLSSMPIVRGLYEPITFQQEKPIEGRQVDCASMNDDIDSFVKMVRKELILPPLHCAVYAWEWAPNITKYLVESGENVDVVSDVEWFDLKEATPIDLTLAQIAYDFNQHYHLYEATHRKPIYDLLVFLCHQTRVPLEILRMLVKHNQNTERVTAAIVNYARRAQLVHLASMFLAAPEIFFSSSAEGEDCLFDQLYKHFNILKLRTSMHEELSKLLNVLAVVGHKLVAYIRLDCSDVQTPRLTYMDIALLLHEVSCKQEFSSPDNDFFRFFEADLPISLYEPDYAVQSPAGSATKFPWALLFVPDHLREKHIKRDYINRLFPSPNPEDTDSLNSAIETKLSSMSTLRSCPEDVTRVPKTGESYLPGGVPFPPRRIREPKLQSYLPQRVPFPRGRNHEPKPPSFLPPGVPFPLGRNHEPTLRSFRRYRTRACTSDRFDVKFTPKTIWEKKVIKGTRLKSISAKLPVFVKRLIK